MARKKPINPLADLPASPLSGGQKNAGKNKPVYINPLAKLPAAEMKKAVRQRSQAGQYKKRTFLIPPDMDEIINQIVAESGIKRMELGRWLLAKGIESYLHGEKPEVEQIMSVRVKIPQYKRESG